VGILPILEKPTNFVTVRQCYMQLETVQGFLIYYMQTDGLSDRRTDRAKATDVCFLHFVAKVRKKNKLSNMKWKGNKRNAESLWTVCHGAECNCNAAVVLGVITFVLCAELYSILAIFSFHIYGLQSVSRLIPSVDLLLRKVRYQMGVSFYPKLYDTPGEE